MKVIGISRLTFAIGALCALGCGAATDSESSASAEVAQPLTGYYNWSWGTTTDTQGIKLAAIDDQTCVLAGVTGNLSAGLESFDDQTRAGMVGRNGYWWLVGHGGRHYNANHQLVWDNNPVLGEATCFLVPTKMYDWWESQPAHQGPAPPRKVYDLGGSTRHCYLGWIAGGEGAFTSTQSYAEVVRIPVADSTHPSPGWYVQSNAPTPVNGYTVKVGAICTDFPAGTVFTSGTQVGTAGSYVRITSGGGIKGCALTGVVGAFTQNDWDNGILIKPPTQIDGNWSIKVTQKKVAVWSCAK
jgi:hypothetical protein